MSININQINVITGVLGVSVLLLGLLLVGDESMA